MSGITTSSVAMPAPAGLTVTSLGAEKPVDTRLSKESFIEEENFFVNQETIQSLPKALQNSIYAKIYELSGSPQTSDLEWGKTHLQDNQAILREAFYEVVVGPMSSLLPSDEGEMNALFQKIWEEHGSPMGDPKFGMHHLFSSLEKLQKHVPFTIVSQKDEGLGKVFDLRDTQFEKMLEMTALQGDQKQIVLSGGISFEVFDLYSSLKNGEEVELSFENPLDLVPLIICADFFGDTKTVEKLLEQINFSTIDPSMFSAENLEHLQQIFPLMSIEGQDTVRELFQKKVEEMISSAVNEEREIPFDTLNAFPDFFKNECRALSLNRVNGAEGILQNLADIFPNVKKLEIRESISSVQYLRLPEQWYDSIEELRILNSSTAMLLGVHHAPELKLLDISGSQMSDFPVGCKKLEVVRAIGVEIEDTDALDELENLRELVIDGSGTIDGAFVSRVPYGCNNLERIILRNCCGLVVSIRDLDGLKNLRELEIDSVYAKRVPVGCVNLERLVLRGACGLADISGLDGLEHLREVKITGRVYAENLREELQLLFERAPVGCNNLQRFTVNAAPYLRDISGLQGTESLQRLEVNGVRLDPKTQCMLEDT